MYLGILDIFVLNLNPHCGPIMSTSCNALHFKPLFLYVRSTK